MAAVSPEPAHKAFLTLAGLRSAAKQTPGLQRVPQELQDAISSFLAEQSFQDVKTSVARLATTMRDHRLKARGSPSGVEESQPSSLALQAAAEIGDDRFLKKRWQAPPERPPVKYEAQQTVAYVAARLPSVYAAVHRVLSEVSRRVPDLKPTTVMDYGSGPGTVLWAAREVWPTSVKHVNLVEPSPAMAHACRSMLKDQEGLPIIQSYSSLETFAESRGGQKSRLHDIVVASYSLGELPSMAKRISAVRQLWSLTRDILVLIEPGTPEGFQVVHEMRKHVLQMEKKKVRKQLQRSRNQESLLGEDEATLAGDKTETGGAFVVAPCAHDGSCPMENTGRWCHFAQRVERTPCQRITKRLTGAPLRGYEDEKFSFVVLRHGVRPRVPWPMKLLADDPMPITGRTDLMLDDNDALPKDVQGKSAQIQKRLEWITALLDLRAEKGEACDTEMDDDPVDEGEALSEREFALDSLQGLGNSQEEWSEDDQVVYPPETASEEIDDSDSQTVDAGEEGHEMDPETADLGGGWARIVQPPMKRGGHVYLDLCCSAGSDVCKGELQRMVAVRSGTRALYMQARKSRWGDLWPC